MDPTQGALATANKSWLSAVLGKRTFKTKAIQDCSALPDPQACIWGQETAWWGVCVGVFTHKALSFQKMGNTRASFTTLFLIPPGLLIQN